MTVPLCVHSQYQHSGIFADITVYILPQWQKSNNKNHVMLGNQCKHLSNRLNIVKAVSCKYKECMTSQPYIL